ncbi:hypothetical protein AVEN_119500-1 [Araneus ventricosus]|uniref:Uncharacterized protein n=1 Tax=Araneus ventricosus TaxID=182803 RepID=A0A4Y2T3X3_ARAVE|nr:hypothetical protein AVEN_119500-1 [Araneus ventricosus]
MIRQQVEHVSVCTVTNMESPFPAMLVLWFGREFYRDGAVVPSGKTTASGPEEYVQNPISLKCVFGGLLHIKSYVVGQTSSCWCVVEVWREGCQFSCRPRHLAAVLKLLDPSQNSSRVASKSDVNITKI